MPTADKVTLELEAISAGYQRSLQQAESTFRRSMVGVQQSATNLTNFIGGALAGAAAKFFAAFATVRVYQFIRSTIDQKAALVDLADRLKISTDQLQRYQAAAQQANIENQEFNNMLFIFARGVGDAVRGQGDLGKVLELNGIAYRDNAGNIRDLNLIFEDYIDLLGRSKDAATTAKLSQIGFGRAAQEVGTLAKGGAKAFRAAGDEAAKAGAVIAEGPLREAAKLDNQFVALEQQFKATFEQLAISVGPAVEAMLSEFQKLVSFLDRNPLLSKVLGGALVGARFGGLAGAVVGGAIGGVQELSKGNLSGTEFGKKLGDALIGVDRPAPGFEGFKTVDDVAAFLGKPPVTTPGAGKPVTPKLPVTPGPKSEYERATEALKDQIEALKTEAASYGKSTYAIEKERAALALRQAAAAAGIPINKDVAKTIDEQSDAYARQKAILEELQLQQERVTQAANDSFEAVKQGFVGWITGANSAKEALAGILQRLAEIAANAAFESIFSPGGAGGVGRGPLGGIFSGIGKVIGGLFGGGGGAPMILSGARAGGGPVSAGGAYRVGERGPETFVPTVDGAIIPNGIGAQRSIGGSRTSTFHITVEASGNDDTDTRMIARLEGALRAITRDEMMEGRKIRGSLNPVFQRT